MPVAGGRERHRLAVSAAVLIKTDAFARGPALPLCQRLTPSPAVPLQPGASARCFLGNLSYDITDEQVPDQRDDATLS